MSARPSCQMASNSTCRMALAPAVLWPCRAAGFFLPSLPGLTGGLGRVPGCTTSSRGGSLQLQHLGDRGRNGQHFGKTALPTHSWPTSKFEQRLPLLAIQSHRGERGAHTSDPLVQHNARPWSLLPAPRDGLRRSAGPALRLAPRLAAFFPIKSKRGVTGVEVF